MKDKTNIDTPNNVHPQGSIRSDVGGSSIIVLSTVLICLGDVGAFEGLSENVTEGL